MSKYCGLCDENIGDSKWDEHNQSWQHKRNGQQRDHALILEIEDTWHGISQNDIIFVFSWFGPIVKIKMHTKLVPAMGYAYVEFAKPSIVNKIVTQTFYSIKGHLVKASRWTTEKQRNASYELEEKERTLSREKEKQHLRDIFSSVRLVVKTEQQLHQLVWMQELPSADRKAAEEVRMSLEDTIKQYIPEARVNLVGSHANGLGVRGADVNIEVRIVIDAPQNSVRDRQTKAPELSSFLLKQTGFQVSGGRVTLASFTQETKKLQRYWLIYEILSRSPLSLNLGRMRLIKTRQYFQIYFRHLGHQLDCKIQIRIGKSLNVQIARFIHLLVNLDTRVRPLYLTIKFWAKQVGVFDCIKSYGLFLLVYFFLQSVRPAILPTCEALNALCPEKEKVVIDSTDVSFYKNVAKIQELCIREKNTQTICELVLGFFKFYAKFELCNRVFCPRSGRSYNMLKFRNMKKVVPHLGNFSIATSCLHIQDLFREKLNIAPHSVYSDKHRLCLEFLRAATIVQDFVVDRSSDLLSLFPTSQNQRDTDTLLRRAPIAIPFDATLLPPGFLSYGSYTMAENQWYQWIVEMTMRLLQILRIDYKLEGDFGEDENGKPSAKRLKTEGLISADRHTALNFEASFEPLRTVVSECRIACVDEMHLWKRRSIPRGHPKGDVFTTEERVTAQLLETFRVPAIDEPHRFTLLIQHIKTSNETLLEMCSEGTRTEDQPLHFMNFMNFFQEYVMRIICKEVGIDISLLSAKFRS